MLTAPQAIADRLLEARRGGAPVRPDEVRVADAATAYAVQDLVATQLGPVAAWKVGAKNATALPSCAPLPASGVKPSGAAFQGPQARLRGAELEVAVRLGRDLSGEDAKDPARLVAAIDALLPTLEVLESRLTDRAADFHLNLADFLCHGGLVLGTPQPWRAIDLPSLRTRLSFGGRQVADTTGGHTTGDLLPLVAWLAAHAEGRGRPLKAGDVITTGSCTGMLFTEAGTLVEGDVAGLGTVRLQF